MSNCPVCSVMGSDIKVDENMASREGLTSEYFGKTYYFEDAEHKKMFDSNPERYRNGRESAVG